MDAARPSPARCRFGRTPRWLAAVALVLQGLLWGGGSILEARSAAESLTRLAHIEDSGASTCPPIHSHLDCVVCRTISHGATGGTAPSLFVVRGGGVARPIGALERPPTYLVHGANGPRAPPCA